MSNILTYLPGGIKRTPLNYEQLWRSFIDKGKEHEEWCKAVYVPGKHQAVSQAWVSKQVDKELKEKEEGI